jgi:dihydrofolate synthase/folylpolyglutamate synthase
LAHARWPGRFEIVHKRAKTILLDGAHNPQAMQNFVETLKSSPWRDKPKVFIVGFLRDKDHPQMVRLLTPWLQRVIVTQPPNARAFSALELTREIAATAPDSEISLMPDPSKAIKAGLSDPTGQVVCVCGSFYLVGLARRLLKA